MACSAIPDFFLIGAPKCGTTALYSYLKGHPNVYAPAKELHFFSTDFPNYGRVKSKEEYTALYRDRSSRDQLKGEASVFYLFSEVAVAKIMRANPRAKMVVMLRDPVDMVQALHWQKLHSMDEDEADFETAWRLQETRGRGQCLPTGCREPKHLQYRRVCSFADQLRRLYDAVPDDQRQVLIYEEFAAEPMLAYRNCLAFLGLDDDGRTEFGRVNASHQWRWRGVMSLLKSVKKSDPYMAAKTMANAVGLTPGLAVKRLNKVERKRPGISQELRQELIACFADDVAETERLLGRELPWQRLSSSTGQKDRTNKEFHNPSDRDFL
ncbi:MAG: sulfotransferase [Geminicoccaceae bacterium]